MKIKKRKMKKSKGFTLSELLMVTAIIAILATIVLYSVSAARKKTKTTRAQADLEQMEISIEMLESDTAQHPGHSPVNPCIRAVASVEMDLCQAGMKCSDGSFPNWKGPYFKNEPVDPWGSKYIFDSNYQCNGQSGCQNRPVGTSVRAIVSLGENKNFDRGGDDIARVICE